VYLIVTFDGMSHIIAPSLLSADFNHLYKDIQLVNESDADWFHVDVMDGVFVPNISFGFPIMKHLKKLATKPLDVHLMIVQPDRYLEEFAKAGADILTVHYEACPHIHRTLQSIRSLGMKAGVAVNPGTPVGMLEDILHDADLFLVMSVNPGFGGQKFIPHTFDKIRQLRSMIEAVESSAMIEVDGGVDLSNYRDLIDSGADAMVAGNAIFGSANPKDTITEMKSI
jgi:ribulose-phosphate 3-epimerase